MTRRAAQRTILIVGEGTTEVAFLNYLKSIYLTRGCGVSLTVKNGQGGGPDHVLDRAIRLSQGFDYDLKFVLMDTDIQWSDALIKKASSKKIYLVGASPCVEGLMLKIVGRQVLQTSNECKTEFQNFIGKSTTQVESYAGVMPKNVLEQMRKTIPELDALLNLMCGIK
jgi:uncharacterized protein with HEPN domain